METENNRFPRHETHCGTNFRVQKKDSWGFVNDGTAEVRNCRSTEVRETRLKRETRMNAEKAGMGADCSDWESSSEPRFDRGFSLKYRPLGSQRWRPEAFLKRMNIYPGAWSFQASE
jgi:hypothetical protein